MFVTNHLVAVLSKHKDCEAKTNVLSSFYNFTPLEEFPRRKQNYFEVTQM